MNALNDHDGRVAAFRAVVASGTDSRAVVEEHLLHAACVAVDDSQHFQLKSRIAAEFNIQAVTDVFVVGSSKLGFSIAPSKRYREFKESSDVDVAIVNHSLYQRIWHEVDEYRRVGSDWPKRVKFEQYLALGWIRPDMLPSSPVFQVANDWFEFFRKMQAERVAGPLKIAAGLYHDMEFLLRYQIQAVDACRVEEAV